MLITASHLQTLLEAAQCSPEEFGVLMGISGMTVRRWLAHTSKKEAMPSSYLPQLREALYGLVAEGKLPTDHALTREIIGTETPAHMQASLKVLCGDANPVSTPGEQGWLETLNKIGTHAQHVKAVDNIRTWTRFFKLASGKKSRILTLLSIIRDSKRPAFGKSLAYGALFYLITPFDLIPDHIPALGFLDDFGALEAAVSYYLSSRSKA